ncbi:MAG: aldo/keto reductase [Armatimonadota bacterium]|jgi:aryl-alcohol dehydrogenase-like predicted oxidoreductase
MMDMRKLGRSGIEVSPMGLGTWAMGGPTTHGGLQSGWGEVDDDQSMAALERGLEFGVNFIDTADVYGTGHSERLVGQVIAGRRDEIIVATKFGFEYDEIQREISGGRGDRDYVMEACDRSLERLGIDTIDLYQFHLGGYDGDAEETRDALEELVAEGKIRWFGWSTDNPDNARIFAEADHCCAVQQSLSVLGGNWETLRVCHEEDLASINRGPLVKGLLTGKFTHDSTFGDRDNRRRWDLREGTQAEQLRMFEQVRDVLASAGRTPAQGALCWLWGLSDRTIPIPGVKTPEQAEENARAMEHGPLSVDEMQQIDEILGRDGGYREWPV